MFLHVAIFLPFRKGQDHLWNVTWILFTQEYIIEGLGKIGTVSLDREKTIFSIDKLRRCTSFKQTVIYYTQGWFGPNFVDNLLNGVRQI